MEIIKCNYKDHSSQIIEIYNDYINSSTYTYRNSLWDKNQIFDWFKNKEEQSIPIAGIKEENKNNEKIIGFASYDKFRMQEGYQYSVEHSFYVHKNYTNQGAGKQLLKWIIDNTQKQGYRCLIAIIDSKNIKSIKLHKKFDFIFGGKIKSVGFKLNKWLDIDFYYKILNLS